MAEQSPEPQPWVGSGTLFGMLSPRQQESVLKQVAKEAAALFRIYRETFKEATGLKEAPSPQRLDAYRARAPELWQNIQTRFPQDFDRQMKDWTALERKESV